MTDYPEPEPDMSPAAYPALNFPWMLQVPPEVSTEAMPGKTICWPADTSGPQPAAPDAAQRELRIALHRLSTHLRQSIDAQQRALADIGDVLEVLR